MDDRFHLKIEFEIYGKKSHWDCSLNWSPLDPAGVDHRIIEWFEEKYAEAHQAWLVVNDEKERHYEAEIKKQNELAELARLLAKYPPSQ